MSALKYWLWLTELRGLKNQTRLALLRHFGTPEAVFYADAGEILLTEGITRVDAALLENHKLDAADRILADCQRLGIRILTIQDAEYPARLKNIYDPPCLLYVKGQLPAFDETVAVAVVGTRDCTPYGVQCAEKLSRRRCHRGQRSCQRHRRRGQPRCAAGRRNYRGRAGQRRGRPLSGREPLSV